MKALRSFVLAASALLSIAAVLATTVIPPTFDELVGQAETIFEGTVTDVQSQWAGEGGQRHIVTFVTFKVNDVIKGEPGQSYTLRMLGGTIGDTTMEVTDTPKFKQGDRDIVFVENNGRQFVPLVGIMHGRFRVQKDEQSGADRVATNSGKPVGDLARLGQDKSAAIGGHAHDHGTDANARSLSAAEFKAAVRAKLTATR
jgi:hypothetical protein